MAQNSVIFYILLLLLFLSIWKKNPPESNEEFKILITSEIFKHTTTLE